MLPGDSLHPASLGLQVHGDEDAGEIEHRRQDGHDCDLSIRDSREFGHEEGRRSHDRGHDLASRAGRGLDCGRELRPVAHLLHHRDRDRAGADGVGHRGARGHALEGGGHDRDLCRSSGEASDRRVGEADEEVGDSGALQERAEDDEDDDVLHTDADGGGEDAVGRVEERPDQLCDPDSACKGVDHQRACDAQYGKTHAAAAQLHKREDADRSDHHEQRIGHDSCRHPDHRHGVGGVEEVGPCAHDHHDDVIPWHAVDALDSLPHREREKA